MTLYGHDLVVTKTDGEVMGYVLKADDPESIVHTSAMPNIPLNTAVSTPTQAGGVYDVRDTEGDKAITHLDWSSGMGQKSLDTPDSSYDRYYLSSYIDVSAPGRISLLRPFTENTYANIGGQMYSAIGKLWMATANGGLKYSTNGGTTWSSASITAGPTSAITDFCTDGTTLYFCCPGDTSGVWSGTGTSFAKFGSTGTTATIEKMAYNAGILYAATGTGAGKLDKTTGVYTEATSSFLANSNTVALVSTSNSVFWVVSKNGASFAYRMWYNIDTSTTEVEQFAEYPLGFVATCAIGYLGNLDVGGYYESSISGVGQGAVYRTPGDGGETELLFALGDKPEEHPSPTPSTHDHRIRASVAGGKDTFWLTERGLYRWDLDSGGYSHHGDFPGCGTITQVDTLADPSTLPAGGTITTSGNYRIHTFTSSGTFTAPQHLDQWGNTITNLHVDYLVVAGGGGGGTSGGGGGGGGGVRSGTGHNIESLPQSISIVVGNGGASATNGSASSFGTIAETVGGGKGGNAGSAGSTGGSGGGAGSSTSPLSGGTGTTGEGFNGGANDYVTGGHRATGGGGGAAEVGADGVDSLES